jgi:hypothetical protein
MNTIISILQRAKPLFDVQTQPKEVKTTKQTLNRSANKIDLDPSISREKTLKETYENSNAAGVPRDLTESIFNKTFFSAENIDLLQQEIIQQVFVQSSRKISRQSDRELSIIMRSVYLQFSTNPLFSKNDFKDAKKVQKVRDEIQKLNLIVIGQVLPQILSETKGYLRYLQDISSPRVPINLPVSTKKLRSDGVELFKLKN